jgi:alkylhydroperoxidase family enzyme
VGSAQRIRPEKLAAVAAFEESERFDELEKLALRYADGMTRTPADVPGDVFDALRQRLGPEELVELTTAIAWENFRARWNRALLIESDGLAPQVCLLAERG